MAENTEVVDDDEDGQTIDLDNVERDIMGNRRLILDALNYWDGEANTVQIRTHPNPPIPRGSIHHDLRVLKKAGIIETVTDENGNRVTEQIKSGRHASVHSITELGEEVVKELGSTDLPSDADFDDMRKLVSEIKEREDEVLKRIETLENRYDAVVDRIEN